MYRVKNQLNWQEALEQGLTGRNITIAVLDTGIAAHPDFNGRIIAFKDFIHNKGKYYDDSSHGTHVCGIIAGNGSLSEGKFCGIAPMANLVVGKILDENGNGTIESMDRAIRWLIENRQVYHIRILNISIGTQMEDEATTKAIMECVEKAWNAGIIVVTAAGNGGPKLMSISSIGVSNKVLTVGCHDGGFFGTREDLCENYSGRGPTRFSLKKPDVVAPGTDIISCNGKIRKVRNTYQNPYVAKSGTSMATPIVSGACALYLEKYPSAGNDEVKQRIIYSARDMNENWTKQGWGMLDIQKLLQ
ncbi:MAG: S8 family peptidase [Lachnospiraceae bacterium]|nr:S8 family peptidase [Lachnospiraceae bacterium]